MCFDGGGAMSQNRGGARGGEKPHPPLPFKLFSLLTIFTLFILTLFIFTLKIISLNFFYFSSYNIRIGIYHMTHAERQKKYYEKHKEEQKRAREENGLSTYNKYHQRYYFKKKKAKEQK